MVPFLGNYIYYNFFLEFGQSIQWAFNRAPVLDYLHGAFESDINKAARISPTKPKQASQPRLASSQRQRLAAIPTKVTTSATKRDKNEANKDAVESTEQFVEQIYDIIAREYRSNKKQPVCYYSLVTNPKSFSATVKTMFYLSFLVKGQFENLMLTSVRLLPGAQKYL